ncbi:MAG: helix-turn-helix transcriptional regulator [Xanthobacteraceae bacterium]
MTNSKKIIRRPEVVARTGLSKSTIQRLEAAGEFPKHFPISKNLVGWSEHEIDEWISGLKQWCHVRL